jgi:hypothetical protein
MRDAVFVPLVGSAGRNESHYQSHVDRRPRGPSANGTAMFFNIPAFVRRPAGHGYVLGDPQLKAIQ